MFDLNHLSILKKGQSRSINWENRKGEKGMGGRAASDLGTARKGSPCIPEIKSGETVTRVQMAVEIVAFPSWISVCALPSHTSVPWDRPAIRTRSEKL